MNLLLDPGGTRLKFAQVEGGTVAQSGAVSWDVLCGLDASATPWTAPEWVRSSPAGCRITTLDRPAPPAAGKGWLNTFLSAVGQNAVNAGLLDPLVQPGFDIGYVSGMPGADRIAAAIACHRSDPGGSFIIIDAGTCITVDLLSPGIWRGGAILPGLTLQAASMQRAGLPEIHPDSSGRWGGKSGAEGALGVDTMSAIEAGIPWAVRESVTALARALMELDPCAQVVITGGDAAHFEGLGGWRTFADPNLVLKGGAQLLNERNS